MLAWHFTRTDCRLGFDDGRLVVPGETLTHDGDLVLCKQGLHASRRIMDALRWAPGPYVWRVRLSGDRLNDSDKMVATERTALWGFDATDTLRLFARRCALDVLHLWDPPDVVVRYLKTGDESIRDAAGVAWADARGAARGAARDAAWDAARAAARAAAWASARAAARDAAWDAARDKQYSQLTAMVMAARKEVMA